MQWTIIQTLVRIHAQKQDIVALGLTSHRGHTTFSAAWCWLAVQYHGFRRSEDTPEGRLWIPSRVPNKMVQVASLMTIKSLVAESMLYRSDNDMYDHMNNSVYSFLYDP